MRGPIGNTRRTMMAVVRGSTPNHLHLRERLVFLWGSTVVLDLVFSVLAHLFKTGRPGSGLHDYGDALFWTTTQLLTVSSQLPNPVTASGKVLDVVMQLVAVTIITSQAGALGSFLYRHSMERNPLPVHHAPPASPAAEPEAGA